jgi:hypothetical protein
MELRRYLDTRLKEVNWTIKLKTPLSAL